MSDEHPKVVFLVTQGEYSDYHIERAFSTMALAEQWVALMNRYRSTWSSEYVIETYPLDAATDLESMRDGKVLWGYWIADRPDHYDNVYLLVDLEDVQSDIGVVTVEPFQREKRWTVTVWARDENHARKIGQDKIAEFRAKEAGIAS